ncbi:MAG: gamma-glutamyl-gamma-aminobutyrate hydrolase family protein [Acidobacteria bacterium]|nr:gamma-glutamyl-gamma-aminobutyrate hydrolase family protein [Acidobacteriota bacterium]
MRVGVTYRKQDKLEPYQRALRAAGLEAVPITPPALATLDGLAGLVLTGGTDIDPAEYRARRERQTQPPDGPRDRLERALLEQALERDLPVLAICRGMQLLNVVQGGTLVQHLPEHVSPRHLVRLKPGTRTAAILGLPPLRVNSRHHQALDRLGQELIVSARSLDGVIEAVEHRGKRFVLAVQWHPEDLVAEFRQRKLFEAFRGAVTGPGDEPGRSEPDPQK